MTDKACPWASWMCFWVTLQESQRICFPNWIWKASAWHRNCQVHPTIIWSQSYICSLKPLCQSRKAERKLLSRLQNESPEICSIWWWFLWDLWTQDAWTETLTRWVHLASGPLWLITADIMWSSLQRILPWIAVLSNGLTSPLLHLPDVKQRWKFRTTSLPKNLAGFAKLGHSNVKKAQRLFPTICFLWGVLFWRILYYDQLLLCRKSFVRCFFFSFLGGFFVMHEKLKWQ